MAIGLFLCQVCSKRNRKRPGRQSISSCFSGQMTGPSGISLMDEVIISNICGYEPPNSEVLPTEVWNTAKKWWMVSDPQNRQLMVSWCLNSRGSMATGCHFSADSVHPSSDPKTWQILPKRMSMGWFQTLEVGKLPGVIIYIYYMYICICMYICI